MDFIRAGRVLMRHVGPEGPHLWLILTDPDPKTDRVLAVMVVTTKTYTDKAVLHAGDHPRIVRDSSLDCGCAKRFRARRLRAEIADGRSVLQANMARTVLESVRGAFLASPRRTYADADYCRARLKAEG